MPDLQSIGIVNRWVFENPWPLGLGLLAGAIVLGWWGLREGLMGRVKIAWVAAGLGTAVLLTGTMVTTAGERAELLVRQLVKAVVAADVVGGMSLFSTDAIMNVGSPLNPGFGYDSIQIQFARLAERYVIESNSITMIRASTLSANLAEVRLACITTVEGYPYPNTSQWIFRVERVPDGEWRITRLTCVAINDRTPPFERIW